MGCAEKGAEFGAEKGLDVEDAGATSENRLDVTGGLGAENEL